MVSTGVERGSFSVGEVGERWHVSHWTVRRLIKRGDLKAVYIGGLLRIPRSEVERAEQFGTGSAPKRGK